MWKKGAFSGRLSSCWTAATYELKTGQAGAEPSAKSSRWKSAIETPSILTGLTPPNLTAKKKPILTVNAAGRHAKKLLDYSADFPEYRLAAMRYVLSQSVESNWEKLYPITKPDDFNRWLHDNYGVQVGHVEPEVEYFE